MRGSSRRRRNTSYNEYEYAASACGATTAAAEMEEAVPARQRRLLGAASLWRFLYVADCEAQAEDDVHEATLHYRQHMHHVREAYNPSDFRVSAGGQVTTNWQVPRPGIAAIQLDIDPEELGSNYPLHAALLGDAKVML